MTTITSTKPKKAKRYRLLFSELFFPDWRTGYGKGEAKRFPRGELVEVTETGIKPRVKVVSSPEYQAFLQIGESLVAEAYFDEIEVKRISDCALKKICPT